jgi:hypothetical protein
MNDHFRDVRKMINDTPRTDAAEYESQDEPVAKLGAVDADFARQLERELNDGIDRIKRLISERDTARMQADQKVSLRKEFSELLGTDDIEQGIAFVCDLKQLVAVRLAYIQQLEEQLMDVKNKHSVLVADVVLNDDRAERIKQLEEAGDYLCAAAAFMGWHDKIETWNKAKEAKL